MFAFLPKCTILNLVTYIYIKNSAKPPTKKHCRTFQLELVTHILLLVLKYYNVKELDRMYMGQ